MIPLPESSPAMHTALAIQRGSHTLCWIVFQTYLLFYYFPNTLCVCFHCITALHPFLGILMKPQQRILPCCYWNPPTSALTGDWGKSPKHSLEREDGISLYCCNPHHTVAPTMEKNSSLHPLCPKHVPINQFLRLCPFLLLFDGNVFSDHVVSFAVGIMQGSTNTASHCNLVPGHSFSQRSFLCRNFSDLRCENLSEGWAVNKGINYSVNHKRLHIIVTQPNNSLIDTCLY